MKARTSKGMIRESYDHLGKLGNSVFRKNFSELLREAHLTDHARTVSPKLRIVVGSVVGWIVQPVEARAANGKRTVMLSDVGGASQRCDTVVMLRGVTFGRALRGTLRGTGAWGTGARRARSIVSPAFARPHAGWTSQPDGSKCEKRTSRTSTGANYLPSITRNARKTHQKSIHECEKRTPVSLAYDSNPTNLIRLIASIGLSIASIIPGCIQNSHRFFSAGWVC